MNNTYSQDYIKALSNIGMLKRSNWVKDIINGVGTVGYKGLLAGGLGGLGLAYLYDKVTSPTDSDITQLENTLLEEEMNRNRRKFDEKKRKANGIGREQSKVQTPIRDIF